MCNEAVEAILSNLENGSCLTHPFKKLLGTPLKFGFILLLEFLITRGV
jgi:hypothetical protein